MNDDDVSRTYRLPPKLADAWEEFHRPGKNFKPSVAGAFLIWMSLSADIREKACKAAYEDNLKKSIESIKKDLSESLSSEIINQWLAGNTPAARKAMLSAAKAVEEKLAGKK